MRGKARDKIPRPNLGRAVRNSRVYGALTSDVTKMYGVLGMVVIAMTVSAAGILSGVGLFLVAMINMASVNVVLSSLLLSFSVAVFLLCYGWLTA